MNKQFSDVFSLLFHATNMQFSRKCGRIADFISAEDIPDMNPKLPRSQVMNQTN
jgi:hypothetical protein